MPTIMDSMGRHLATMEKELAKGRGADMAVIADASSKFLLNDSRTTWGGIRLEVRNQLMDRWIDLNEQIKALAIHQQQRRSHQEEQLCLAI